jgi:hypothetical protein
MNNVKWILGFLATVSLQASATLVQEIQTQINTQLQVQHLTTQVNVLAAAPIKLTPIRMGKMKVKVSKTTISTGADGNYQFTSTPVCSAEVSVNVYDGRGGVNVTITEDDLNSFTCNTVFLGSPIMLKVGGLLALTNSTIFDQPEDFKMGIAVFWIDPKTPAPLAKNSSALMASHDINAHSLLGFLEAHDAWTCKDNGAGGKTCAPAVNEYFSAAVDLQD